MGFVSCSTQRLLQLTLGAALIALILVWPLTAGAQEPMTSAIHGGYAGDSKFCLVCHDIEEAPPPRFAKERSLLRDEDEKAVCYTCHNGTSSGDNIKDEFGDTGKGTSTKESVHPVPQGTILCGDCHSVHLKPDNQDGIDTREVIRLVRVVFGIPWSPIPWFGYLVRPDNLAWIDQAITPTTPGAQVRLPDPNLACGVCHRDDPISKGGDHYTNYTGTSHDVAVTGAGNQDTVTVTQIKCLKCHASHASDIRPLLTGAIEGQTVTGNNNSVCFGCHLMAAGSYSGRTTYELTAHGNVTSSNKAATSWATDAYEPTLCLNCHNPHGTASTDYRRVDKNALCQGCHDVVEAPADYSYQGSSAYEATPHANAANANTVWPFPGDTGAAVPPDGSTEGAAAGECINCHDIHGRDDGAGAVTAKLTLRKEESLCFGGDEALGACHASTTGSSKGTNIWARFNGSPEPLSRHSLTDDEQQTGGSKVECINCHDVHLDTAAGPTIDPDSRFVTFAGEMNDPKLYPQAVLQPDPVRAKDSTIASETGAADLNFGNIPVMVAGSLSLDSARRPLIEFDLSSIPTTAAVDQATLWLYQSGGVGTSPLEVEVRRITAGWSESTVTWNSAPPIEATASAVAVLDTSVGWRSWDITTLVQGWVNSSSPNYGIMLLAPAAEGQEQDWHREFESSDQDLIPTSGFTVAPRPKLIVKTSSSPPKVYDAVGFCGRCHDNQAPPGVTVPGGVRIVAGRYNDSDPTGDFHGAATAAAFQAELIGPYYPAQPALSCNDCHDSHGSPNVYGLKESVNGKSGISIPTVDSTAGMQEFCTSCHMFKDTRVGNCFSCHFHGANTDTDSFTRF